MTDYMIGVLALIVLMHTIVITGSVRRLRETVASLTDHIANRPTPPTPEQFDDRLTSYRRRRRDERP